MIQLPVASSNNGSRNEQAQANGIGALLKGLEQSFRMRHAVTAVGQTQEDGVAFQVGFDKQPPLRAAPNGPDTVTEQIQ